MVTPAELAARVVLGQTREDDYLDFKGLDSKGKPYSDDREGKRECAGDVAQFGNGSGGTIVIGAPEQDHVVQGFEDVPGPENLVRWIGDVLDGHLEPVPPIDPRIITVPRGARVVAVNVPPSAALIARKTGKGYEFPIRAGDGKRYMTLMEVEARMQNRERLARLRLEQIKPEDRVWLDAAQLIGRAPMEWSVRSVDDHAVMLSQAGVPAIVPLAYVEAVYRADERSPHAEWVVALDCKVQFSDTRPPRFQVTKWWR